jgi:hypothetical protein
MFAAAGEVVGSSAIEKGEANMNRKLTLACMAIWLGGVAGSVQAGEQATELFVDRHEIDDYAGLIYTPIVTRFRSGEVKYKVTVPVVQFMSPPSAGFYTDEAMTLGRPGALSYAEIGDITAKASTRVWGSKLTGTRVDVASKLTFATGNAALDIGSGRTEAELGVDVTQPMRSFELLAGVAYVARHSYTKDPAIGGVTSYVGAAFNLSARTYLDATYEYEQPTQPGDPAKRKWSLALNHGSGAQWSLRSYASLKLEGEKRKEELGFSLVKSW